MMQCAAIRTIWVPIMCYLCPKEDQAITVKTKFRLVVDNCVSHNPAALPYYRVFNIQFHVSSHIKTAITHCYSYTAQQGVQFKMTICLLATMTLNSAPHVNNMATEQCMHALDHLALGRGGQFCD